jgi:hypothetical protein
VAHGASSSISVTLPYTRMFRGGLPKRGLLRHLPLLKHGSKADTLIEADSAGPFDALHLGPALDDSISERALGNRWLARVATEALVRFVQLADLDAPTFEGAIIEKLSEHVLAIAVLVPSRPRRRTRCTRTARCPQHRFGRRWERWACYAHCGAGSGWPEPKRASIGHCARVASRSARTEAAVRLDSPGSKFAQR